MRIYSSVIEAVKEIERELYEFGIENRSSTVQDLDVRENPDYNSKELINYGYVLTGFGDLPSLFEYFFPLDRLDAIRQYAVTELSDRVGSVPLNPGNSWQYRKEYWQTFLHEGKFSYTYSERISFQLDRVVKELRDNPASRQCVITIYDAHQDLQNFGGLKRIPCSFHYHFLRRKISERYCLFMSYVMRSCDFYTHFPIDVWLAIGLGKYIGDQIGSELHSLTHFIGSLHAFQKDFGKRRIF